MTRKTEATVQLHLSDGTALQTWTEFSFRRRYDDALEDFSFQIAPIPAERSRIFELTQKGEVATITINGTPQATCIITRQRRKLTRRGVEVGIEAKGMLATAAEGYIDPMFSQSVVGGAPLRGVLLEVFSPYGFTSIDVDAAADVSAITGKNLAGRQDPVIIDDLTQKDLKGEKEESVLQFARQLTTRNGIMLGTNRFGGLMLSVPDFGQAPAYACVEGGGGRFGDLMRVDIGIEDFNTNDGVFSEVHVHGRASQSEDGEKVSAPPTAGVYAPFAGAPERPTDAPFPQSRLVTVPPGRHTYRSTVHPFKPRYKVDKKSTDRVRCENTARVLNGARAADAYQLKFSVDGLISASGGCIWAVDTVGSIYSETLEIDEPMWLYEVEQGEAFSGGQYTSLTWIPLGSLELRG